MSSSGRTSWAKGTKLEFLESYKQEFLDSQDDERGSGILNFGPKVSEEESGERRLLYKRVRDNNAVNEILQALRQMTTDMPCKQTALQLYTSLHYKTKIKADVDKEWAKLQADTKKNGTTVSIPRIALTNEFLVRRFAEEPEDVQEGLEQQTKEDFVKAKAAFKTKANWKP
ncbi:hypothetical protein H0H92_006708 [Tricholoma furcatifolium]|nr:hypothetical protein H0H92_006708 [Tricholoma furcatifolium]